MAELADLDSRHHAVVNSPGKIKQVQHREERAQQRRAEILKAREEREKKAKLAFGPGARDFRKAKPQTDARKEKAAQDRAAARARREQRQNSDSESVAPRSQNEEVVQEWRKAQAHERQ